MIDATIPTGSTLASELPTLLREMRAMLNTLEQAIGLLGGTPVAQSVSLSPGTEAFEVASGIITTVSLSATAATDLTTITAGRNGQLIVIRAEDADVTVIHNASSIMLNNAMDWQFAEGDVLFMVNFGGNPTADPPVNGIWVEVNRYSWVA